MSRRPSARRGTCGDCVIVEPLSRADANGDVSAQHYVQVVNDHYAIWDKTTGQPVQIAKRIRTLFAGMKNADGTPHPCATFDSFDPYARFDRFATGGGRWIITHPMTEGDYKFQCFAVSKTSSPIVGGWHQFAFEHPEPDDYAKIALWPSPTDDPQTDAYYVTFSANFTGPGGFTRATRVCALERQRMLNPLLGTPREICHLFTHSVQTYVQPSDTDGPNPPPAGSPNYLIALGVPDQNGNATDLRLWKFRVLNWNAGTFSFSGPSLIDVADYSELRAGVPQMGGGGLDPFGDRVMNRFAYRRYGVPPV